MRKSPVSGVVSTRSGFRGSGKLHVARAVLKMQGVHACLHGATMRSPRAVPTVPSRATETTAYEDTLPALPKEVWAYIFDIRAATTIQASVRGLRTRRGPRYLATFVKRGWLRPVRAMFWAAEFERRTAHRRVLMEMWGEVAQSGMAHAAVEVCVD